MDNINLYLFTLNAGSDLMSIMVSTVSCKIEFPAFLLVSVFVQTLKLNSFVNVTKIIVINIKLNDIYLSKNVVH